MDALYVTSSVFTCTFCTIPKILATTRIAGRCGMRRCGLQHHALTCIVFECMVHPLNRRFLRLRSEGSFALSRILVQSPNRALSCPQGGDNTTLYPKARHRGTQAATWRGSLSAEKEECKDAKCVRHCILTSLNLEAASTIGCRASPTARRHSSLQC